MRPMPTRGWSPARRSRRRRRPRRWAATCHPTPRTPRSSRRSARRSRRSACCSPMRRRVSTWPPRVTDCCADPATFPDLVETLGLRLRTDRARPAVALGHASRPMPRRFDARFFAAALLERRRGDARRRRGRGARLAHAARRARRDGGRDDRDVAADLGDAPAAGARDVDRRDPRHAPAPTALGDDRRRGRSTPTSPGSRCPPVAASPDSRSMPISSDGQRLVLVDPGDPTGPALDRAIELAAERGGRIVAVALTHVDPDHAAGAEALAEMLAVPGPRLADPGAATCRTTSSRSSTATSSTPGMSRSGSSPRPARRSTTSRSSSRTAGSCSPATSTASAARALSAGPIDRCRWDASVARLRREASNARWLPGHPA